MAELSVVMKKIRAVRRINSHELAMALGMSPSYLSLIEQGKRSIPTGFVSRVIDILNLTNDERCELLEVAIEDERKFPFDTLEILARKKEILALVHQLFVKIQSGDLESGLFQKIIEILENLERASNNIKQEGRIVERELAEVA